MHSRRPSLAPAKISAPRSLKSYARTRLFKSLDKLRQRPVIWISGPAGAGKTTLAVSYLNARSIQLLWYQLDVRDSDPAALFYYLREALGNVAPRRKHRLSLLTPEYLAGLAAFTKNFFERLYAQMRPPAALVFDNFQDLPEHCITQKLLESALAEIPDGVQVIFLSCVGPPPGLARLELQRSLCVLDAESLKLTRTEARAIARLQIGRHVDQKRLDLLHGRVQGWMAGWILLLTHLRTGGPSSEGVPRKARDILFQYFASELFERSPPAVRDLLLKTSLLPQIAPASAIALTGDDTAAATLENLERRNYFTTRLTTNEPVYQFHPLFRAFLRERLTRTCSPEELLALQTRAAALLCELGEYEDAAALMIESKDQDGLMRLVLAQAPVLAQQGRLETLETWLRDLPTSILQSHAWISYWLGTCRLAADLKEARTHWERAYALFKSGGDMLGRYCAWAAIIESYYYEWDDFTPVDAWFEEMDSLQRESPSSQWPDVDVRVVYAALMLLGFARGSRHDIGAWVERAWAMWNSKLDLRARGPIIACLGLYYFWKGNAGQLRPFLADVRQYASSESLDPFVRLQFHWILCSQWMVGDLSGSMDWVQRALAFSERVGIRLFDGFFLSCGAAICQIQDDVRGAAEYTERLRLTLTPGRSVNVSLHLYYDSWLKQRRRDYSSACILLEEALTIAIKADARHAVGVIRASLAECLTPLGESRGARAHIDAAERWAHEADNAMLQFICHLARAWDALRNGSESECATRLSEAFQYGRVHDFTFYPSWIAPKMSELCAFAVHRGIEHEYAAKLIRLRNLEPVADTATLRHWPFPVKIFAMGHFSIVRDGELLQFAGKTPKKPLELLKGIIASGGRNVRERPLGIALWPRAEDPVQALAVALHRLRKLIGEEAIERQAGHVSLNARHVFVDVWALEQKLMQAVVARDADDPEAAARRSKELSDLYSGEFLSGDADARWAAPMRERLREKTVSQLRAAANVMEREGRQADAATVIERATEIESRDYS